MILISKDMEEEIIYSLNTKDIQIVAENVLGRQLSDKELDYVKESVPKQIDWFTAIEIAIHEGEYSLSE